LGTVGSPEREAAKNILEFFSMPKGSTLLIPRKNKIVFLKKLKN
jgi:hypothetical protein